MSDKVQRKARKYDDIVPLAGKPSVEKWLAGLKEWHGMTTAPLVTGPIICRGKKVFGENTPVRRRAVIDEIWNEDGVFYDPISGAH
jgi:hypothetical protein